MDKLIVLCDLSWVQGFLEKMGYPDKAKSIKQVIDKIMDEYING